MALDTLTTEAMVSIGTQWLGSQRDLLASLPSAALLLPLLDDVHEHLRGAHRSAREELLARARQRWLRAVRALLSVVALEDAAGTVLLELESAIDGAAG